MTQYMLLFSLGPVQPFIAQARKTRDLWQGSFLLSTLMESAMQGIDSSALVFPTEPAIKDNIPDLPNKYIAIFNTEQQASNTALKSKQQIEACWQSICQDVWKEIIEKHARFRTEQTRRIWERQTNPARCFEIYWVIVEGDSSPEHYQQWLQKTQAALDARKRFRNFLPQDEPGEKSTISGLREALRGSGVTRQDVQMFWRDLAQHLSAKDISQDGTERLDAIDTVKRFAVQSNFFQKKNFKADFPSTSSVATASFVAQLFQTQIDPSVLDKWLQATNAPLDSMQPETIPYLYNLAKEDSTLLKILKRDGDCFFPETFTPRRLYKDYGLPSNAPGTQQRAEQCYKATTAMLTAVSQAGLSQPTPYYALLQMDGDHMGTLLSGVHDREEHKAISGQLSHFAREDVPRLVQKKHPARLVYAGGDDVLAFSPLEELFKLADELQQTYCEQLRNIVSDEERKKQVTASMGIVIA
ncbi:MAG: type III-B CRISPR-associated protein Cas10/Cmr2, partial [Ktedonobacteraceae bacterium]|nr:type III-B CRISPR-associated protein Cas10/Cmr2 [Ktedonobacteraceae bacterium]